MALTSFGIPEIRNVAADTYVIRIKIGVSGRADTATGIEIECESIRADLTEFIFGIPDTRR